MARLMVHFGWECSMEDFFMEKLMKMDRLQAGMLSWTPFLNSYQLLGFFSPHRPTATQSNSGPTLRELSPICMKWFLSLLRAELVVRETENIAFEIFSVLLWILLWKVACLFNLENSDFCFIIMTCNTWCWLAKPEPEPFDAEFVMVAPLLERVECCRFVRNLQRILNIFAYSVRLLFQFFCKIV